MILMLTEIESWTWINMEGKKRDCWVLDLKFRLGVLKSGGRDGMHWMDGIVTRSLNAPDQQSIKVYPMGSLSVSRSITMICTKPSQILKYQQSVSYHIKSEDVANVHCS
ncbi:hypothetical protein BSKO_09679 [Bryopsis sp. KO-2023]|nr:hypothetical protein BSKO_09679 [Bryopsis sp. KO-2023]